MWHYIICTWQHQIGVRLIFHYICIQVTYTTCFYVCCPECQVLDNSVVFILDWVQCHQSIIGTLTSYSNQTINKTNCLQMLIHT